jgi:hypothetical protein
VYTPEITEKLAEAYRLGKTPDELSLEFPFSRNSIIAKLSTLGVYQRRVYVDKRGNLPRRKSELVDEIAKLLGTDSLTIESLEKASKHTLLLLIEHLKLNSNPQP